MPPGFQEAFFIVKYQHSFLMGGVGGTGGAGGTANTGASGAGGGGGGAGGAGGGAGGAGGGGGGGGGGATSLMDNSDCVGVSAFLAFVFCAIIWVETVHTNSSSSNFFIIIFLDEIQIPKYSIKNKKPLSYKKTGDALGIGKQETLPEGIFK